MGVIRKQYARKLAGWVYGQRDVDSVDLDDAIALFQFGDHDDWGPVWGAELLAVPLHAPTPWNDELVSQRIDFVLKRNLELTFGTTDRSKIPPTTFMWVNDFVVALFRKVCQDRLQIAWQFERLLGLLHGFSALMPKPLESGVEVGWHLLRDNKSKLHRPKHVLKELIVRSTTPAHHWAAILAFPNKNLFVTVSRAILAEFKGEVTRTVLDSWSCVFDSLEDWDSDSDPFEGYWKLAV